MCVSRMTTEEKSELTRKEKDAIKYVKLAGMEGLDVKGLAKALDISYPAAYSLLKNSEEKGWLQFKWAKQGNKGKFYPK
jgi:transposase